MEEIQNGLKTIIIVIFAFIIAYALILTGDLYFFIASSYS